MSPFLQSIDKFDKKIMTAVIRMRSAAWISLFKILTESARGYAWAVYVLLINIFLFFQLNILEQESLLLKATFCPLFAWFFGQMIKILVARKRPSQSHEKFKALTHSPLNDSFPSLHAASTTSFFMGLLVSHHPYAPWVGAWALLVTFSRLYLGVHYLSDLLAGMILGIGCGLLIYFL